MMNDLSDRFDDSKPQSEGGGDYRPSQKGRGARVGALAATLKATRFPLLRGGQERSTASLSEIISETLGDAGPVNGTNVIRKLFCRLSKKSNIGWFTLLGMVAKYSNLFITLFISTDK